MKYLWIIFILFGLASCSIVDSEISGDKAFSVDDTVNNNQNEPKEKVSLEDYLDSIKPKEYRLSQVLQVDIDNDKNTEIVASFGYPGSKGSGSFNKNFLIRESDNGYMNIGELKQSSAAIAALRIIKLDNTGISYILGDITNDAGGVGCIIYGLNKNNISVIYEGFPGTGKGAISLSDSDNDCIFERLNYFEYDDIQLHGFTTKYKWDGKSFIEQAVEVSYPYNNDNKFSYPPEPEDVIQCYIEAVYHKLYAEINQLISEGTVVNIEILDYYGDNDEFEYGLFLEHELIKDGDGIKVIYTKDNSKEFGLYFTLERARDVWKIKSISSEKPQEN